MYIPSPPLGKLGWLPDQPAHRLPVGAWSDVRNMRFDDQYVERIWEPTEGIPLPGAEDAVWFQEYDDSFGPRIVVATLTKLYRLNVTGDGWDDVSKGLGSYTSSTEWQSFELGSAVVFNNGLDAPQVLFDQAAEFVDMPNWGELTSGNVAIAARSIRLYEPYMVATNISIDGVDEPNAVMWSDPVLIDNITTAGDMPSWDYESTETTAGKNPVGVDEGPLQDSLTLNNIHILYTQKAAYAMQFVGGTFIFDFRRLFSYGAVRINAVCQFLNYHFVISPTTIYVHDGSTVKLIGEDKVQESFYKDWLKDLLNISCVNAQDVNHKEIHTVFNSKFEQERHYLIYNYQDDNWSVGQAWTQPDATVEPVAAMGYGFEIDTETDTWATVSTNWNTETRRWTDFKGSGQKQVMYWLTNKALYKAEKDPRSDASKAYTLTHSNMDFSELAAEMTTDQWKHLNQIIPHIEGAALADFSIAGAESLGSGLLPGETASFNPVGSQYKLDYRVTGRWLSLGVSLTSDGAWRWSTADYDMEPLYGR